jgi:hypothetical protein
VRKLHEAELRARDAAHAVALEEHGAHAFAARRQRAAAGWSSLASRMRHRTWHKLLQAAAQCERRLQSEIAEQRRIDEMEAAVEEHAKVLSAERHERSVQLAAAEACRVAEVHQLEQLLAAEEDKLRRAHEQVSKHAKVAATREELERAHARALADAEARHKKTVATLERKLEKANVSLDALRRRTEQLEGLLDM